MNSKEKAQKTMAAAAKRAGRLDSGGSEQQQSIAAENGGVNGDDVTVAVEFVPADGGFRAWLACLASFCTNGTIFSIINSFGIISDWLITGSGISKSVAGSIGSATIGCVFFFSFFGSIVMDRVGIRRCAFAGAAICTASFLGSSFVAPAQATLLFFTHSFLFGFGASLVYTPSLVILGHHFDRRLGLANGIVTLGSGVFSVVLSRILKPVLLDRIGVHNTFRVYCGMAALLFAYAFTWKPMRPIRHAELDHYLSRGSGATSRIAGIRTFLAKFLNVSIWRNRGFLVWIVGCPFAMFGYFVPFMFLPNFVQDRALELANITSEAAAAAVAATASAAAAAAAAAAAGGNATAANWTAQLDALSPLSAALAAAREQAQADSALLLICISVASGVCRIVTGRLADLKCVNRIYLQQAAFFILGISISLFPLCHHRVPMVLLALLFGACDGTFVCMIGPIAFDLVGPTGASQAIGFLLQLISIPTTTGPLLTGYINDRTGRWDLPFYISGASPVIGSLIMFLIPHTKQAYPAATVAEDFDQMTKSNLDIQAYDEALTDPNGIWQKAPSVVSLTRSAVSLADQQQPHQYRRRRRDGSRVVGNSTTDAEAEEPLTAPTEADETAAEATESAPATEAAAESAEAAPVQNGKTTEITIRESTL